VISAWVLGLAVSAATPPPGVSVPTVAGYTCATRKVQNDNVDLTEVRCTQTVKQGLPVVLEARLYGVVTTPPPDVNVLCKADLKRNHAMVFDAFEKTSATLVTLHGLQACRVELTGKHGTLGAPWHLVEVTVPLKDRWLAMTAQGPVASMASQDAAVEHFLAETAAK
jgi:hypothetical protein